MSLESGLTMIAIGIPYVFSIMTIIIIICLILKKTFRRKILPVETKETGEEEEQKLAEEGKEINEEEVAAITAAVGAYISKTPPVSEWPTPSSRDKNQYGIWSFAGRMELMNRTVWREEKWGGNLRSRLERKRL